MNERHNKTGRNKTSSTVGFIDYSYTSMIQSLDLVHYRCMTLIRLALFYRCNYDDPDIVT